MKALLYSIIVTMLFICTSCVDMVIDGSGTSEYGELGSGNGGNSTRSVMAGDSAVFVIELTTDVTGGLMSVVWNAPPGWLVTFDGNTSPLANYPAGIYDLKVVVPSSAPSGPYDIIVDAWIEGTPFNYDSVLGRVIVVTPAVDALIDGNGDGIVGSPGSGAGGSSLKNAHAASTVDFILEIQNQGIQPDSYTIQWNQIPSWIATLDLSPSPFTTGSIASGTSAFYTFSVQVPPGAAPGNYQYIIDIVSNSDPNTTESVAARIVIADPPLVDLVIDGDGSGVFGPIGSGDGGESVRPANPGSFYIAALRVENAGGSPDSFLVWWEQPVWWPAGSVVLSNGAVDFLSPFTTPVILPGSFLDYEVKVQVPGTLQGGLFATIINSQSFLAPGAGESVELITLTGAVVQGIVFDDKDHDSLFSPGDAGIGGAAVREDIAGIDVVTSGDGSFTLILPGGAVAYIIEKNPSGYISLTPDSLGPFTLQAGDTVNVAFADVPPIDLSPGTVLTGLAGSYVDFPHSVRAGTKGQVTINTTGGAGAVISLFYDSNGNGIFDNGDRTLLPADGALDPEAGNARLDFLVRIFIPGTAQPGQSLQVDVEAVQSIDGTPFISTAVTSDVAVVAGTALGRLRLSKTVDKAGALPGEVITYSINFFNAGTDTVQNVVLLDPVSDYVALVSDAFGPGQDVEWQRQGIGTQYLTLDPSDGDQCEYSSAENLLRIIFSKLSPIFVLPGESGIITYKVSVK